MLFLTTNHKVGDTVYVLGDCCVNRGSITKVVFQQLAQLEFSLHYDIRYDGYAFDVTVESEVELAGSPLYGSPLPLVVGSPETVVGSPAVVGSPEVPNMVPNMVPLEDVTVVEVADGGGIFTNKNDAVAASADLLP